MHDKSSPQSKAGFLVLLVSFLAIAFALTSTRERLAKELKPAAQPVASDESIISQ